MLGGHPENVAIHEGTRKGMTRFTPQVICRMILNDPFRFSRFNLFVFIIWFHLYVISCWQVVKIGVVGGSDLVKISEQLGQTGYLQPEH